MNLKNIARHVAALLLLASAALGAHAQIAFQDHFNGGWSNGWIVEDGYANQFPYDPANHAAFAFTPSQLSISFAGGQEHNMWWMRQAQILRNYMGAGVYETKVDSALTGDQQFGFIFQTGPATFMIFMLYSYTNDQIRAYVERFVWSPYTGGVAKTTFYGGGLGLPMPSVGPFHLRVEVADAANPANRTWKFSWSRDGDAWTNLVSGVLEGAGADQNIGAIAKVGLFAGNQPQNYSAFDARFDYFRYYASPLHLPVQKTVNVATRAGDRRVDLWWDPVESAQQYAVYLLGTAGAQPTLLGRTTSTSFADLGLTNGASRTYSIVAERDGLQGKGSDPITATPNFSPIDALPAAGMVLSLSASDLAASYSNGTAVSIWPNARGPFTSASASASARPTLVYSALNGQPVVRFDGVDDHLALPTGFQDFTAGMSLYVVMRSASTNGSAKVFLLGNGPGQANVSFGRAGAALQYFTTNAIGDYGWFNTQDAIAPGEAAMLSVIQNAGAVGTMSYAAVGKNGATVNGQNIFVPPVAARGLNYIGKSYWSDLPFHGDIAEILLYNRKLSASEQSIVLNYLGQKYAIQLAPQAPLAAPAGLTASAGNGFVSLSWGSVIDAVSYRVYRSPQSSGPFALIGNSNGTSFTDSSVVNGTTYYYAVTANDGARESLLSSSVIAVPIAPLTPTPNPLLPSSGLVIALDAEIAALQYGNGTAVPVWLDRSGQARNASASGSSLPVLVTGAINGRPALRFDGVDDFLSLPSGFSDFTAGMSLYVVVRPTAVSSGAKLVMLGNGPAQDNIGIGRNGGSLGLQYFTSNNVGTFGWFASQDALVTGEAALISLTQEPGAANASTYAELAKNGVSLAGQNVFVPPVVARNANYIGKSFWSSDTFFKGDIAEVILYNRKLTAQEHVTVRGYLLGKYGLQQ